MQRVDLWIASAFFVSSLFACGSDPTDSAGAGAMGGTGGSGSMDGGFGASGSGGAAGSFDAGDATCPSIDAAPPCEKALTGDIFDPGEVYVAGALREATGGQYALAHVRCSNVAVMGFDGTAYGNVYIRPTDGRLLYWHRNEPGIRELHADGCLRVAGANGELPPPPSGNDPLLLGACPVGPSATELLVSPDGFFMLHCADNKWSDIGEKHVYVDEGDPLLYLGYGNLALTKTRVIDLGTGTGSLIALPAGIIYAIRAVPPDKFWIVSRLSADASQALFEIDREGSVSQLGTYPTPPNDVFVGSTGRLDKSGALYQRTKRQSNAMLEEIIMRRDIEGTFEVFYAESSNPFVHRRRFEAHHGALKNPSPARAMTASRGL